MLAGLTLVSLMILALLSDLSASWLFPGEQRGSYVESLSIVGTLVPLTVLSGVLDEGLPSVVLTARRSLIAERLGWATGFVVVLTGGVAGVAALVGLPTEHFARVSCLLAGVSLLGLAMVGLRGAWVAPAAVVAVVSTPGLVSLRYNFIYSLALEDELTVATICLLVSGLIVYARRGSAHGAVARAGDVQRSP